MCLPPTDGDVAYQSASRNHLAAVVPPRRSAVVDDDDASPRVTFDQSNDQVHVVVTALSCLEDAKDRRQLWYNKEDIKGFRRTAQALTKQLREGGAAAAPADVYTRGLELRMSLQRQDRKQMVVKKILDAQDDDCTPEELAQITQEHSLWSRKLALAQAHKDYYAAYHPNLTSVLPEMPALLDCRKDMITKKRSLLGSSLTQTGRRVRCRMF